MEANCKFIDECPETGQMSETWSIDDDTLFYPLGLINHSTGTKSVFVTWSEDYLLNFIFKTSEKSKKTSLTKVRLDLPNEEIIRILILEFNTLLHMQSGNIFYFSSVKSINVVPWLTGIQCISPSIDGFSVIRVLSDNTLNLETYKDVANLGNLSSTCIKKYDITFDDHNIFNSQWNDERFTIYPQAVHNDNRSFLHEVSRMVDDLKGVKEIYFFTISRSLFVLIPGKHSEGKDNDGDHNMTSSIENNYHIEQLSSQVSNIEFIEILTESNLILIFEQCGIIEIWYLSNISQGLERMHHVTGSTFTHYEFFGSSFYFTNEEKVFKHQFKYDPIEDICMIHESSRNVFGVVAVTWMESNQQLICLNGNNIFYSISFTSNDNTTEEYEKPSNTLLQLDNRRMKEFMSRTNIVHELSKVPGEIHKLIEEEYLRQELLAVGWNSGIHSKIIKAKVNFSSHIPENENSSLIIFPGNNFCITPKTYYGILTLFITHNDIFKTSLWKLLICFNGFIQTHTISKELIGTWFNIVIPVERNGLIPNFDIQLVSCVNIGFDFLAVKIPVTTKEQSFKKLFSLNPSRQICKNMKSSDNIILSFIGNENSIINNGEIIRCKLKVPKRTTLQSILSAFNIQLDILTENACCVYFLGKPLNINYSETNSCLTIMTNDAIAMYYAELLIYDKLQQNVVKEAIDFGSLRKSTLVFQSQIERRYVALLNNDKEKQLEQLQNLKNFYKKIREDFELEII